MLGDERTKKKVKKRRFWIREIFGQRERQEVFSNLHFKLQLGDREYYFKYLFNNIFTSVFHKLFKVIRFFDIYIQYTMKV